MLRLPWAGLPGACLPDKSAVDSDWVAYSMTSESQPQEVPKVHRYFWENTLRRDFICSTVSGYFSRATCSGCAINSTSTGGFSRRPVSRAARIFSSNGKDRTYGELKPSIRLRFSCRNITIRRWNGLAVRINVSLAFQLMNPNTRRVIRTIGLYRYFVTSKRSGIMFQS